MYKLIVMYSYEPTLYVVTFPLSLTDVIAPLRFIFTPFTSDELENDDVETPKNPLPSLGPLAPKRESIFGEFYKII